MGCVSALRVPLLAVDPAPCTPFSHRPPLCVLGHFPADIPSAPRPASGDKLLPAAIPSLPSRAGCFRSLLSPTSQHFPDLLILAFAAELVAHLAGVAPPFLTFLLNFRVVTCVPSKQTVAGPVGVRPSHTPAEGKSSSHSGCSGPRVDALMCCAVEPGIYRSC